MRPFTRSCFHLLLLERLFLLPLLWSSPISLHASTLISLSLAKMRLLLILTLSPLTIWYSEQMALLLFLLAKAALGYLPTAFSVTLRLLSSLRYTKYPQVFLLKPAPICKLFAVLGSTNNSAISLLLLSDSCSVLATLSSPLSFLLP